MRNNFKNGQHYSKNVRVFMKPHMLHFSQGHLSIDRHFWQSIFDLLTLKRLLNVFFLRWTRDGAQKNHDLVSAPYQSPKILSHFLSSPFLLLGPISLVKNLGSLNICKIGFAVWCMIFQTKILR